MTTNGERPAAPETLLAQAAEDLFTFAIDREDVKWSLARLPTGAPIDRNAVEYELQALKIITVGWSIAYLLAENLQKERLQVDYWNAVRRFAGSLSETAGLLIGQDIDYFQVLRQRLDMYRAAVSAPQDAVEPAQAIGPAFARACGRPDDLAIAMAGARLFRCAVDRVGTYLTATGIR